MNSIGPGNDGPADEVDYVIVGAGSAGCVLAERLSAGGQHSVMVLEAGAMDSSPKVRIPAAVFFTAGNPKFDWCYICEPDATRNDRSDAWPRGRVVGGSSSTNGQLFVRGQPSDFDDWAALGNTDWSYEQVLPYFKQLESYSGQDDDDCRGRDGAMQVNFVRGPHELSVAFVDAASETGIPATNDYNGRSQFGASIAQANQKRGWRHSSSRAYLHPNLSRKNLTLRTQAKVQCIEIDDGVAHGVRYLHNGKLKSVAARREVILTAGSIASPQLLMLSGVGDETELAEVGVTPKHHLPGVGKNLQEHVGVWLMHRVRDGVQTLNMGFNWRAIIKNGIRFLFSGSGPLATPTAQAVAFIKTSPSLDDPDIQIHFAPLGYDVGVDGVKLLDHPAMLCVVNVNQPESRGEVRLASNDPDAAPRIMARLLDSADDMTRLIAGCRITRNIMAAPSLAKYSREELFPGPEVETEAQWEEIVRAAAGPCYHIVGTCKMGSDANAVVDAELRVHGIENLRVADASIMPTITSGNTNSPTMMIAAKAADYILSASKTN